MLVVSVSFLHDEGRGDGGDHSSHVQVDDGMLTLSVPNADVKALGAWRSWFASAVVG